jgi:hypothetical protein
MNQLTDSSFVFVKAPAPFATSKATPQQPSAAQPFSCMSSGRAKARDVEAARRFYVGADKKAS